MSNQITEKYFNPPDLQNHEQKILAEILSQTNFQIEREIFRGQIYDKNKVGSLIYKGIWEQKPAVLKIQGLKPEIDETDIIKKFNSQNLSTKIHLPKLYKSVHWNNHNNYGYLISEFIEAPLIYSEPLANSTERQDFCNFYQEYKTKCLSKPFWKQDKNEQSSLDFTQKRVAHWTKISQSKNDFEPRDLPRLVEFSSLAQKILPSISIEFMHGHLTAADITKISPNKYVLMSNLFWSWRPEFYDTTFHLWMGIKSLRDLKIKSPQIIDYLEDWLASYKKIPVISSDPNFEKKFNIMMLERCVGAFLLDIKNQNYHENRDAHIKNLLEIFRNLFDYFAAKLK